MRRLTRWYGRVLTTIARALERSNRRDQGRAPAPWLFVFCGAALCVCRARRAMHVRTWPWRADRARGGRGAAPRGSSTSRQCTPSRAFGSFSLLFSVAVVRLPFAHKV